MLLLQQNATVTMCHSRTQHLAEHTRRADVLVAAVGKPRFITADMVKPGAIVIDVGINRVDGKVVGDVDFDAVKGGCLLDYACARRRWPYDHYHAAGEHH